MAWNRMGNNPAVSYAGLTVILGMLDIVLE